MNAYLAGGAFGTIGILGGAVLALWWRAKFFKAQGSATLLLFKLTTEEKEHNASLHAALAQAEEFEDEVDRKTTIIARYKDRIHSLRVRELDTANHAELLAIANGLRVAAEDEGSDSGEVANEGSDSEDTMP